MSCENFCRLKPVHASLDRLQEGHYWLHQMEQTYHFPEPFRFSTYAAIRVLGETFEVVYAECVKHSQDRSTFRDLREKLTTNVIAKNIREARNRLTHEGNLTFSDNLSIGNGSPKAMRNSFPACSNIDMATADLCRQQDNIWEDEDFYSIGFRRWFVAEIEPQDEIVEVLCSHWLSLAGYVKNALGQLNLGIGLPVFDLSCRANPAKDFRICVF